MDAELVPASPAAPSEWPKHALFDSRAGLTTLAVCGWPTALVTAPTSMGSPSGVPVPCMDTAIRASAAACPASMAVLRVHSDEWGQAGWVHNVLAPSPAGACSAGRTLVGKLAHCLQERQLVDESLLRESCV